MRTASTDRRRRRRSNTERMGKEENSPQITQMIADEKDSDTKWSDLHTLNFSSASICVICGEFSFPPHDRHLRRVLFRFFTRIPSPSHVLAASRFLDDLEGPGNPAVSLR